MTMAALEYRSSPARYLAARSATATGLGGRLSAALASNVAPVRLVNRAEPRPPGAGWTRLRTLLSGICGSDLGLLTGRTSPYLGPVVSMPFVPGHEVVAQTLDDLPGLPKGSRVVVEPVLSCAVRGVAPCRWCRSGRQSRCDHVTTGGVAAGLQTGFCTDTGGGWSKVMLAHASQLHPVPDTLDTQRAVLVEPLACAIHSARRVTVPAGASVLVVGAGTVGLLTLLALRAVTAAGPIYVIAKHEHQRARAVALGATEVFKPERAARALRRATGGVLEHPVFGAEYLFGGADLAFECTGGTSGLDTALRLVRAGGTVLMSGMPSGTVDLTPVWFRELRLVGSYASDSGGLTDGAPHTAAAGSATAASNGTTSNGTAGNGTAGNGAGHPGAGRTVAGFATAEFTAELDDSGRLATGRTAGLGLAGRRAGGDGAGRGDFAEAIALVGEAPLDGYVDATYPLSRWREAIGHAVAAGRLGSVKVAFDPTRD